MTEHRRQKMKEYRARYREKYPERVRESQRKYAISPKGKKVTTRAHKKYDEKNPDKRRARNAVTYALTSGKLARPKKCEKCEGENNIQAHHPDYQRPLDVEWLCFDCHLLIHNNT